MADVWMVRAGERSRLFEDFKNLGVAGIGWNDLGDLSTIKTLGKVKGKLKTYHPELSDGQINNHAGQIFRFTNKFKFNDFVLTYDSSSRQYLLGVIQSEYKYHLKGFEYHHYREVDWQKEIDRDSLSTPTKNSLGSTLAIFKLNGSSKKEILEGPVDSEDDEIVDETLDEIKEDIESRAVEFIKDRISSLKWDVMQDFVAGILRSLGYKTIVSPVGSDRGKDIIASPDGLGLEDPRILVEVKHRKGKMGAPELRSFIGGLRANEKGIYVSTGGFSKEAKYEAERSNNPITCIDIDMLVQLSIQNYDNFDLETKAILPLKKIYWPI